MLAETVAMLVSSMHDVTQTQTGGNVVIATSNTPPNRVSSPRLTTMGLSSEKRSYLRMKKIKELHELQDLLEQNILTHDEFVKRRSTVLCASSFNSR